MSIRLLSAFVALALLGTPLLRGQVSPSMDSPNTPTGSPEQQSRDNDALQEEVPQKTFKVGTNLVNVFFTVRDKSADPRRLHNLRRQAAAHAEELWPGARPAADPGRAA
jgi:hypothetical protein